MQRDLSYLSRLWKSIDERIEKSSTPAEIYQESDLVIRTLRDIYDSDIERIICDSESVTVRVKDFLDVAVPRAKCKLKLYTGLKGLFEEFGVEDELEKIHSRSVKLDNGGSLVIDQTEALVAIDVNSGSFRTHSNAELNALELNLAAAEEIGRQLRLRDMGGVIVIDFVDMREEKNRRTLEKKMRDILKKDRAKSKVLKISSFGLVEMTRQRLRPSLKQSIYSRCPQCDGTGQIMSQESVALAVMRNLRVACTNEDVANIEISVSTSVAHHLANTQRQHIAQLEKQMEKAIVITANPELTGNDVNTICTNLRGSQVAWESPATQSTKSKKSQLVDIKEILSGKRPLVEAEARADAENGADPETDLKSETIGETEKTDEENTSKKPRRRGRRGGRKRKGKSDSAATESMENKPVQQEQSDETDSSKAAAESVDDKEVATKELPAKIKKFKRKASKTRTKEEKTESSTKAPKTAKRPKRASKKTAIRRETKSGETKTNQAAQDSPAEQPEEDNKAILSEEARKAESPPTKDQPDAEKKKPRRRGSRGGQKHRKKKTDSESSQKEAENTGSEK